MSVDIKYSDRGTFTLTGVFPARLLCAGKIAKTDIVLKFTTAGHIIYNNIITPMQAGKTARLLCAGKKMIDNVSVACEEEVVEPTTQLPAPTISLDGDILSIEHNGSYATAFDILVDGEVVCTEDFNTHRWRRE